jgi:hypothetical protein
MLPMMARYEIRGLVAMTRAKTDFADAANRGERRPQLMRHIGGESAHLLERLFQAAQRGVEHGGEPAHLVVRIVHRQAIVEPRGGNRPRVFGHPFDRREGAAGQRIAADSRDGHRDGQPEHQHHGKLAHLCLHRRLGPSDLDDDARGRERAAERTALGQDAHVAVAAGDRHDAFAHGAALRNRPELGLRVPVDDARAIAAPDLDPRQGEIRVDALRRIDHVHAVFGLIQTGVDPGEVLPQLSIERFGGVAVDEGVDGDNIDAEHDDHRRDVPQRQPHTDAVRLPPAGVHGSPSRRMKPTPRTV